MWKLVYVPQSRYARLSRNCLDYQIAGLVTDSFSVCTIIACIGQDKIALAHVDQLMISSSDHQLQEMVEWCGEDCKVTLISRKNCEPDVKDKVTEFFAESLPQTTPYLYELDNLNVQSIELSFIADLDGQQLAIHPVVKPILQYCPNTPSPVINSASSRHSDTQAAISGYGRDDLNQFTIHHPLEKNFFTVDNIEHVIGARSRRQTRERNIRTRCIFDGNSFSNIFDHELTIDDEHPLTKEELGYFHADLPYFVAVKIIDDIILTKMSKDTFKGDKEKTAFPTAMWLEFYLNDFRPFKIFKKNTLASLNPFSMISKELYLKPETDGDFMINFVLTAMLQVDNESTTNNIRQTMNDHYKNGNCTAYIRKLKTDIDLYLRQYHVLSQYDRHEKNVQQNIAAALELAKAGGAHYKSAQYQQASDKYLQCLIRSIHAYTANSPELATAYRNYGMALYRIAEQELNNKNADPQKLLAKLSHAKAVLSTALHLKQGDAKLSAVCHAIDQQITKFSKQVDAMGATSMFAGKGLFAQPLGYQAASAENCEGILAEVLSQFFPGQP